MIYPLLMSMMLAVTTVQAGVYRWVDQGGRVSFSDKKPPQAAAQDLSQRYNDSGASQTELALVPVGTDVSPALESRLRVAIDSIRDIFTYNLGVNSEFSRFELHIYGDRRRFIEDRDRLAPGLRTTTGFFDHRRNIAYVWENKHAEALLEVVTHEVAHAMLDTHYPLMPKWLNEGLAEYVQRLRVSGQAIAVPPDRQNLDSLKRHRSANALLPVEEFLALSNSEWLRYDNSEHIAYAQSWALVFFLMSSHQGTQVLTRALDGVAAGTQCCAEQVESSYPGGINSLSQNLSQWLDGPGIQPHHY